MRQHLRVCVVGSGVAALFLMLVAPSLAQGRIRGQVTDEYDNAIPGATIVAEAPGAESTATTDNNGRFVFVGLSGEITFTVTAPGYVSLFTTRTVRRLAGGRPLDFELPAAASGQRFRSETTYVSDPPGTTISFDADGSFEFEDAEGDGEGTYSMQGVNGELVVRKYDGPDDKFSIAEPITIQFADDQLTSFMMGDQKLVKQ